jgi:hypothetical protein
MDGETGIDFTARVVAPAIYTGSSLFLVQGQFEVID